MVEMTNNKFQRSFIIISSLILSLLLAEISFCDEKEDYFSLHQAYEDGFYSLTLSAVKAFYKKYPQSTFKEDVILIEGLSLYRLEKFSQAMDVLRPLIESKESRIREQAYFYLGKLYDLAGEKKKAQQNFLYLIQNTQEQKLLLTSLYELGLLQFKENNYNQAISTWKKILEHEQIPGDLKLNLIYNLILAHFKNQKFKEAEELIDKYLREDAPAFLYFKARLSFYKKNFPNSLDAFNKIIESDYAQIWKKKAKLGKIWVLIELKEFDQAEEILSKLEDLDDEIYYLKAFLFYKKAEFNSAIRYYQRFISKFRGSDWTEKAYLELVDCYYNINKFNLAEKIAQDFFSARPGSSNLEQMHYLLGWVYYKAGELEKAIQEFGWVAQNSKDIDLKINAYCRMGDLFSELGDFDKAIEQYNLVLKNYPDSLYAEYAQYQLGIDLFEKADYESAILALTTLLKNFPRSTLSDKVHYHLTLAYFKKGDLILALEEVNLLLNFYPNSSLREKAFLHKAIILYNLGRYREVIEFIKNCKSIQSQAYAHFILAKAYLKINEYKLAGEEYNWLKENLKEPELLAYLYLQIAELKFYLEDWEQAIINFQNAYQIAKEKEIKEQALHWQALCYYNKGELSKALTLFGQLQSSHGLKDVSMFYSALILKAQGNVTEAIKTLELLLDAGSKFARLAELKLGEIYNELKNYDKALQCYKNLEGAPYDVISAEASFKIGEIYEALEDIESALLQYLKMASVFDSKIPFVNKARIRSARILEIKGRLEEAKRIYLQLSSCTGEEAIYAKERLEQLQE